MVQQQLPRENTDPYEHYQTEDEEMQGKHPYLKYVMPNQTPDGQLLPSYHPTGIALADRSLDIADRLTHGHADVIQRAFSYLFIGGIAAIINLITLQLMLNALSHATFPYGFQYAIAFATATEISILANFIPNDRITFSHLPGHSRTWIQRCARFHVTCVGGILVTLAVSSLLHLVFGAPALVAQAVALIIATAFNFTFHHLFTYRHQSEPVL